MVRLADKAYRKEYFALWAAQRRFAVSELLPKSGQAVQVRLCQCTGQHQGRTWARAAQLSGTGQRSAAQRSAAQRSTAQHSAAQRSTAQHSAARQSRAELAVRQAASLPPRVRVRPQGAAPAASSSRPAGKGGKGPAGEPHQDPKARAQAIIAGIMQVGTLGPDGGPGA
jgi:hypothetical protein